MYWHLQADNNGNGDFQRFWSVNNYDIKVPDSEWFTTEFFWHRSTDSDGRFGWAVNGHIIADHFGPNKISDPINRVMLFQAYSSGETPDQWVDDIEIWDGFPCGDGLPCYNHPSTGIKKDT